MLYVQEFAFKNYQIFPESLFETVDESAEWKQCWLYTKGTSTELILYGSVVHRLSFQQLVVYVGRHVHANISVCFVTNRDNLQ